MAPAPDLDRERENPYQRALRLRRCAGAGLLAPPFPGLAEVARDLGVGAEELEDAIRIATLLPPALLRREGIGRKRLRALPWQVLAQAALAGPWPARMQLLRAAEIAP